MPYDYQQLVYRTPQSHPMVVIPQRSQHQNIQPAYGTPTPQHMAQPRAINPSDGTNMQSRTPGHVNVSAQGAPIHAPIARSSSDQKPRLQYSTPTTQMKAPPQRRSSDNVKMQSQPLRPSHPQVIISRPSSTASTPSRVTKPQSSSAPTVDYQQLLLALADDYISQAHALGPRLAVSQDEKMLQKYYKLLSTGIGCLDAILKKYRLHPRQEAQIRLRYATLLFEETDNDVEAETVLSKGVQVAERNRLIDLKYEMQHLLARVMWQGKRGAGIKMVERCVEEAQAYGHVSWVYAFRFLRVGLSLQMESHQEMLAAQQNLRKVSELAGHEGDYAVFVTTAVYEAVVHLRSGAVDSVEQAQRAIASARGRQLQPSVKGLVQVWALLDVVNLACSLLQYNPEQAEEKMGVMQDMMDDGLKAWKEDGTFSVLVESSVQDESAKSAGSVLSKSKDGRDLLRFQWLQKRDLYTLGYFLSGVTTLLRHSITSDKAEKYLREGAKLAHSTMADLDVSSVSLPLAKERTKWRALVQCYLQLHLTLALCARSDWITARLSLSTLEQLSRSALILTSIEPRFAQWTAYLRGTIAQGSGDTDTALNFYKSPLLALPRPSPHRLPSVA
ncbi:hypothetical protein LTS18_008874, partial [Coniosporium uncinatum]